MATCPRRLGPTADSRHVRFEDERRLRPFPMGRNCGARLAGPICGRRFVLLFGRCLRHALLFRQRLGSYYLLHRSRSAPLLHWSPPVAHQEVCLVLLSTVGRVRCRVGCGRCQSLRRSRRKCLLGEAFRIIHEYVALIAAAAQTSCLLSCSACRNSSNCTLTFSSR